MLAPQETVAYPVSMIEFDITNSIPLTLKHRDGRYILFDLLLSPVTCYPLPPITITIFMVSLASSQNSESNTASFFSRTHPVKGDGGSEPRKRSKIFTSSHLKLVVVLTLLSYPFVHYYASTLRIDRSLLWLAASRELHGDNGDQGTSLRNSTVLITGAAGFIGFSVASYILQHGLGRVIGVDHFNDFYDVGLKYKRADMLTRWEHMKLVRGDVCDAPFLRSLLEKHRVTNVLHLAAQAGVRYSLDNPLAYVLEELRHVQEDLCPLPRLVYASSSSVYGSNTKVPFEESYPVDQPSSLYGATKRMDELLALVYFKVFSISSIGLRFFTVYGPWGRPNMAPYIFTEKIEKGQPITVCNRGNMKRDFTYIDDVVRGIAAALAILPRRPRS